MHIVNYQKPGKLERVQKAAKCTYTFFAVESGFLGHSLQLFCFPLALHIAFVQLIPEINTQQQRHLEE